METKRKYKAVKENVEGDFYVEDNCCTMCGVPELIAPELFGGFDSLHQATDNQCFVKKQPINESELRKMINVIESQDIGCIRYCGQNNEIKKRISECGESEQIDWK